MTRSKMLGLVVLALAIVALAVGLVLFQQPAAPAGAEGAVTCTGSAPGMEGDVVVEVVADAATLYSVTVTEHNETEGIGTIAVEQLPGMIVEAQSLQVDAIASCTITSEAIKEAVRNALTSAGFDPAAYGMGGAGITCTGSAPGMEGDVTVEVVADAATLYSITVTEHSETEVIGTIAVVQLPGKILEAQSLQVDAIAGCTVTCDAIKEAVKAALTAGGLDPAAFDKAPEAAGGGDRTAETLDCDVVVIGAGGAGLTAATRAAQEGATVIVVEKMPLVGGNSLKATGGMNAAGTGYQEALGITDSGVQAFIDDTMEGGHQVNDLALVTTMAENSAEAVDWLTELGAPLPKVAATGGTSHKYLHEPEDGSAVGPYLVAALEKAAEGSGVTILLNTKATEILMADGQAAGIKAEGESTDYTINAGAVVVAAGGFGANFEMMAEYDPALANAVTTNHAGATGDGILMAQAVGADVVDMEYIQLHPTVYQETGLLVTESVRSMGGILVNANGERFCNDMDTRDAVSAAELEQPGSYAYIVFDQRIVDDLSSTQKYIQQGLTVQGDTYEELAAAMGLEGDAAANFVATMDAWNASVAAGVDEAFGRDNGMDEDLATAPYYAIKIAPGIHHTMGGLKIDTETQVLDTEGQVIPGLYAAGETTGGVHGGNRIGGNAVCDFVVFGRIAGANAAAWAAK